MVMSAKRERFCQEYAKDCNGTKAAIRAGYSEKTAKSQACRLLTKGDVKARVDELLGEAKEAAGFTAAFIRCEMRELHDHAKLNRDDPSHGLSYSQLQQKVLEAASKNEGMQKTNVKHEGITSVVVKNGVPRGGN